MKSHHKTNSIKYLLAVTLLVTCCFSVQAQFMRSYELKLYQSSLHFDSRSTAVEYAEFDGRESYFVGGASDILENPLMLDFDLDGNLKGGTLYQIPRALLWKIKPANGYRSNNLYGGGTLDIVFSGLIGIGSVQTTDKNRDAIFLRTDIVTNPAGRIGSSPKWFSYGGEREESTLDLEIFEDKKYKEAVMMVGTTNSYGDPDQRRGYIIKTDAFGKLIKSIAVGEPKFINNQNFERYLYNDVEVLKDGSFILTGTANAEGFYRSSVIITKVDKDLNVLWNKIYSIFPGNDLNKVFRIRGIDIKEDEDGNLLLFSKGFDTTINGDLIIWKLKSDGSLIWLRTHRFGGIANFWNVETSIENGRTYYMISSLLDSDPALLKVDNNGGLVWSKKYTSRDLDASTYDLAIYKDKYVLSGQENSQQKNVVLIETTLDGELNGGTSCVAEDVNSVLIKSFYPMVSEADLNVTEVFDYEEHDLKGDRIEVAKNHGCMDEKRKTVSNSNFLLPGKEMTFKTFPNPAIDQFTIRYNLPDLEGTATFILYDMMGKKIKEITGLTGDGELNISTQFLTKGLFQYNLIHNGTPLAQDKILINK